MKKAVFFDRDGTLVKTRKYGEEENVAPRSPKDLELIPDTASPLNQLYKVGYLIIIVSNQPDIALGKIDEETREGLERKFEELLEENGIIVDRIIYCHHHENSTNPNYPNVCDCRKPKPGMILQAAKEHNIDLAKSFLVGDRASDIKAGVDAGVKTTILYDPENTQTSYLINLNINPDYIVKTLGEVTKIICRQ